MKHSWRVTMTQIVFTFVPSVCKDVTFSYGMHEIIYKSEFSTSVPKFTGFMWSRVNILLILTLTKIKYIMLGLYLFRSFNLLSLFCDILEKFGVLLINDHFCKKLKHIFCMRKEKKKKKVHKIKLERKV